MSFKPKSNDNLKDKKRYRAVNGYYKKHTAQKSGKNKCSNMQKQDSKWPTKVWKRKKL
jgi:hypothetical protein